MAGKQVHYAGRLRELLEVLTLNTHGLEKLLKEMRNDDIPYFTKKMDGCFEEIISFYDVLLALYERHNDLVGDLDHLFEDEVQDEDDES